MYMYIRTCTCSDECQDAVGLSDDEDHVVAMQPSLSADSCHNSPKINVSKILIMYMYVHMHVYLQEYNLLS